jgi:hypothetical protein
MNLTTECHSLVYEKGSYAVTRGEGARGQTCGTPADDEKITLQLFTDHGYFLRARQIVSPTPAPKSHEGNGAGVESR